MSTERILNRYKIMADEDGYVIGYYAVLDDDYDYYGQMADFPEVTAGWTKFENGEFVEDLEKKAEIIAEREREAAKPTDMDRLEAQMTYTALMTDTLLPTEEEE